MTYGGWTQCRALGARIASILFALEAAHLEEEAKSTPPDSTSNPRTKRKKHRVILHTSPYLRCVQTSVAVAAGLSEFHSLQNEVRALQKVDQMRHGERKKSDLEANVDDKQDAADLKVLENLPIRPFPKVKLKIDAFLGEWFSPEYYEHITHPPSTPLMLAGAKAELLRRGESIEGSELQSEATPKPNFFPGGWGSPTATADHPERKPLGKVPPIPELELLSPVDIPTRRDRATSFSNMTGSRPLSSPLFKAIGGGYVPPTPRYAILPNDPIPRGYVAHAHEACVEVDYSWDSTRPPQNWGDGGEYGEEWSSMHRRFRSGIARMVNWYSLHYESSLQSHGHMRALHPVHEEDTGEEYEVDMVLILVTHSAGCNALIGALTDQPVLMDVAMASLTMAMRRDLVPASDDTSSQSSAPLRSANTQSRGLSSEGLTLSQEYNVLITASVDHLRTGTGSLSVSTLQNPALTFRSLFIDKQAPKPITLPYIPQRRYKMNRSTMVMSSPIDQTLQAKPQSTGLVYNGVPRSKSATLWGSSSHTQALDEPTKAPQPTARDQELELENKSENAQKDTSSDKDNTRSDSADNTPVSPSSSTWQSPGKSQADTTPVGLWPAREVGTLIESSPGLWSVRRTSHIPSGPPVGIPLEVSERSAATKRRWTVNENSGM